MPESRSKGVFAFFVNNQEHVSGDHELTGSRIKQLAGVPTDYELFQVRGNDIVPVGNEEAVRIPENTHFRAIPAGTFGKHGTIT